MLNFEGRKQWDKAFGENATVVERIGPNTLVMHSKFPQNFLARKLAGQYDFVDAQRTWIDVETDDVSRNKQHVARDARRIVGQCSGATSATYQNGKLGPLIETRPPLLLLLLLPRGAKLVCVCVCVCLLVEETWVFR